MSRKRMVVNIVTIVLMVGLMFTSGGCLGWFTGCLGCVGNIIGDIGEIIGSGELETREMQYTDFTRLDIGSAFEVNITKGDSYSVNITADDNVFSYIDINQSGETLKISLRMPWRYISTTRIVVITMPELRELELSGASKGEVSGFSSSEPIDFTISGASTLNINDIEAGDTEFDISGASKVTGSIVTDDSEFDLSGASTVEISGSSNEMNIEASGASKIRMKEFMVNNADIEFGGGSSGTITVSGELDVDLSGASRLDYYGNPTMDNVDVSGGSSLNEK